MLTHLGFKNWRSLRNVTIDNLTPITVFVGANSSGKTNVVDALNFIRYASDKGIREAVYAFGGREKVQSFGIQSEKVELEFTVIIDSEEPALASTLGLLFGPDDRGIAVTHTIYQGEIELINSVNDNINNTTPRILGSRSFAIPDEVQFKHQLALIQKTSNSIAQRWQILRENFMPLAVLPPDTDPGDLHVIDTTARNTSLILNFMRQEKRSLYDTLQSDLRFLLGHVTHLDVRRDDREVRIAIKENAFTDKDAPTISAGTSRLIAMLTAYYALDMRNAELPGLVVIEEPDTAIHPLLLRKFVELLRTYTAREGYPRQFILTTHNPMFLNLFNPDEVRIVERDEHGETSVSPVDIDIANAWLEHDGAYNLGDLWTTRSLGGVPE